MDAHDGQTPVSEALAYSWMLAGAFAFSCMGILAHELGSRCDWSVIAIARSGLAFLFSLAIVKSAGVPVVFWGTPMLWIRSIAGSLSMLCGFYSFTQLPTSDVITICNMFPIWVALLSWPVLGEKPPASVWISVACAIFGVFLMQQPHIASGNYAVFVALAASVLAAIAMLGLHRLGHIDPRSIVVHFSGVAAVVCIGAFLVSGSPVQHDRLSQSKTIAMLVGVGAAGTIGQILLTKAFAAAPATKVSIVALSQIVFAMMWDVLLDGESLKLETIVGATLIIAPTVWLILHKKAPPGLSLSKASASEGSPERFVG